MRRMALFTGLLLLMISNMIFAQLDPGMIKKPITITSDPSGAEVYLKNKNSWELLGTTPMSKEIRIGEKEIRIFMEGYEEITIKIDTLKKSQFHAKLKKIPMTDLLVKADLNDAEVYLNGTKSGKTNETINKVRLGKYKLLVKKKGFETVYQDLYLKDEQPVELSVKMRAAAPKDRIEQWIYKISGNKPAELNLDGTVWNEGTLISTTLPLKQEGNKISGKNQDYVIKGIVSGKTVYLVLISEQNIYYSYKLKMVKANKHFTILEGFWFYGNDLKQENGGEIYFKKMISDEEIENYLIDISGNKPSEINVEAKWKDNSFLGWGDISLFQKGNKIFGKEKDNSIKGIVSSKKIFLMILSHQFPLYIMKLDIIDNNTLKGEYSDPVARTKEPKKEVVLNKINEEELKQEQKIKINSF